jgi:hypothetical protein
LLKLNNEFLIVIEKNLFYRMIDAQELRAFIENPERYVNGVNLPDNLPVTRTREEIKAMFPTQIELRGYCPVTLKTGDPGFSSLLLGSNDFVAQFGKKLYAMESEEKLMQFMRYANLAHTTCLLNFNFSKDNLGSMTILSFPKNYHLWLHPFP